MATLLPVRNMQPHQRFLAHHFCQKGLHLALTCEKRHEIAAKSTLAHRFDHGRKVVNSAEPESAAEFRLRLLLHGHNLKLLIMDGI